jgi:hypothetical protein
MLIADSRLRDSGPLDSDRRPRKLIYEFKMVLLERKRAILEGKEIIFGTKAMFLE